MSKQNFSTFHQHTTGLHTWSKRIPFDFHLEWKAILHGFKLMIVYRQASSGLNKQSKARDGKSPSPKRPLLQQSSPAGLPVLPMHVFYLINLYWTIFYTIHNCTNILHAVFCILQYPCVPPLPMS